MPPVEDHRYFFALQPDEPGAEAAHGLATRAQDQVGGAVRPKRTLHITLGLVARSQGKPPPGVIDLARRTASWVRMRPFVVALDHLQHWRTGQGLLVLTGGEGVAGVDMLQAALAEALRRKLGAFRPHMSLIWGAREAGLKTANPVQWRASEFVLIRSIYGQSRHDVLGRFPLTD